MVAVEHDVEPREQGRRFGPSQHRTREWAASCSDQGQTRRLRLRLPHQGDEPGEVAARGTEHPDNPVTPSRVQVIGCPAVVPKRDTMRRGCVRGCSRKRTGVWTHEDFDAVLDDQAVRRLRGISRATAIVVEVKRQWHRPRVPSCADTAGLVHVGHPSLDARERLAPEARVSARQGRAHPHSHL